MNRVAEARVQAAADTHVAPRAPRLTPFALRLTILPVLAPRGLFAWLNHLPRHTLS